MSTDYLILYEGLKIFRDTMLHFIVEKLQAGYSNRWTFTYQLSDK